MSRRSRLPKRRRFQNWRGFVCASLAATLCLMLLGSGDALAATPTTGTSITQQFSDGTLPPDATTSDTFEGFLTGPRAVWERLDQNTGGITRSTTVDETQWAHTTRLVDGDVQTIGAEQRSEWSTTWMKVDEANDFSVAKATLGEAEIDVGRTNQATIGIDEAGWRTGQMDWRFGTVTIGDHGETGQLLESDGNFSVRSVQPYLTRQHVATRSVGADTFAVTDGLNNLLE